MYNLRLLVRWWRSYQREVSVVLVVHRMVRDAQDRGTIGEAFAAHGDSAYGWQITRRTRLSRRRTFLLLFRMWGSGWLEVKWVLGRSRRPICRHYTLTPLGRRILTQPEAAS